MLRRISIENFKGIGDRVDIDLKPVTLLFGPNSAGKSTILHAIHYMRALLETGDPDVHRTRLGGAIDLGGFRALVHDHDLDRKVEIGIEFEAVDYLAELVDEIVPEPGLYPAELSAQGAEELFDLRNDRLGYGGAHLEVRVQIEWSRVLNRPLVTRYQVSVDGTEVFGISSSIDESDRWIDSLNLSHWLLDFGDLPSSERTHLTGRIDPCLPDSRSALPKEGERFGESRDSDYGLVFEPLVVQAPTWLERELQALRYVGPIRRSPPREFEEPYTNVDESGWAEGVAAWELLFDEHELRETVNRWLLGSNRFGTDYKAVVTRYMNEEGVQVLKKLAETNDSLKATILEVVGELEERRRLLFEDRRSGKHFEPCSLGEGIAQLIPVLTAALSPRLWDGTRSRKVSLVSIEQPELHIHPRMEVVLGDLFISQMKERQFLIETHSEHLMLRLLRRIRETTERRLALTPNRPRSGRTQGVRLIKVLRDLNVSRKTLVEWFDEYGIELSGSGPNARISREAYDVVLNEFSDNDPPPKRVTVDDIAVVYVENKTGQVEITPLRITDDGDFKDRWPDGFFDEREDELF